MYSLELSRKPCQRSGITGSAYPCAPRRGEKAGRRLWLAASRMSVIPSTLFRSKRLISQSLPHWRPSRYAKRSLPTSSSWCRAKRRNTPHHEICPRRRGQILANGTGRCPSVTRSIYCFSCVGFRSRARRSTYIWSRARNS